MATTLSSYKPVPDCYTWLGDFSSKAVLKFTWCQVPRNCMTVLCGTKPHWLPQDNSTKYEAVEYVAEHTNIIHMTKNNPSDSKGYFWSYSQSFDVIYEHPCSNSRY